MSFIATDRLYISLEDTTVTTTQIYMRLSKMERHRLHPYFRGRFIHRHKGKKPKR